MKKASEFLREGAQTFDDRNAVYGDNYLNVGKIMTGLFPDGLILKTIDDHNRFHILMLNVVKLSRYANNWEKGGHADSAHDGMVYLAMLQSIDEEANKLRDGIAKIKEGKASVNDIRATLGKDKV